MRPMQLAVSLPDDLSSMYYVTRMAHEASLSPYGSADGPPHVVENRNLLSHPDDLRKEAYLTRMTY